MVGISSVWDVVPDDGDLYREVFQEHFGNTNLQVIAVFKACAVPLKACLRPQQDWLFILLFRSSRLQHHPLRLHAHSHRCDVRHCFRSNADFES